MKKWYLGVSAIIILSGGVLLSYLTDHKVSLSTESDLKQFNGTSPSISHSSFSSSSEAIGAHSIQNQNANNLKRADDLDAPSVNSAEASRPSFSDGSKNGVPANAEQDAWTKNIAQFNAETRNASWADLAENGLRESIAKDQALNGKEVTGIECKTTLCKVQFHAENKNEIWSLGQAINLMIIKSQSSAFIPKINARFDESSNTANFYLNASDQSPP